MIAFGNALPVNTINPRGFHIRGDFFVFKIFGAAVTADATIN